MIKTLKSELKLRPTYDEMIGMIESQGDPNRPSIESVIDRRATIFRNNQYGSQFDNIDFLGLKKQEENKVRNELRQAQLRKAGVEKGTSTGVLAVNSVGTVTDGLAFGSSGFNTPFEVELDDANDVGAMLQFRDNLQRFKQQLAEQENEAKDRIMAAMLGDTERYREMVRKQNFEIREMAKNDLIDVHSQSLPAGVPVHSMASDADDTMPDLIPIDGEDEESQEEDGGDLMNKVGLVGDFNPDNLLDNQNIKSTGLMFQLFVRDLLSDEMMELADRLPTEQKKKQYLVSIIEGLKETDEWQQSGFAGKTVKQEAKKFRDMRRNKKNKPKTQEGGSSSRSSLATGEASSSGGGIVSAIASGAKAVGGAILEAGKEAVKDAVVAGAQNAVLSIL